MKYTIQAIQYSIKNILYLLPLAVLPALFLSASTDRVAIDIIFTSFIDFKVKTWTFADLFCSISVLNFGSLKSIGFGLLGIVAIIACVCMMMAFLEKHMRYGKRTFNGVFSKINDNLLPTLGFGVLVIVIYEFWALLTAALLFFVSEIEVVWLAYTFITVILLAMHFGLLYAINMFYLWLPCMQITGFKAIEALQYSNQLSTPAKLHIILPQTLSLFIVETLIFMTVHFAVNTLMFTIISTILYMTLLIVFCVRMEIVYFDYDAIERRDLRKYY